MNSNKFKVVLVSALSLTLFTGVVVLSSYAIFSDFKDVESHVEAGTLKLGLSRTSLSGTLVNEETGKIEEFNDNNKVDLIKDETSVFKFNNIAPTIYQTATFEIENKGSLAFNYSLDIVDVAKDSDVNLLKQIEISILNNSSEEILKSTLFNLKDDSTSSLMGELEKDAKSTFSITARFLDDVNNNLTQGKSLSFDIKVYAEQLTKN